MSVQETIALILSILIAGLLGLYMAFYDPPPEPILRGECLEYRQARQTGWFLSSVECVRWQE